MSSISSVATSLRQPHNTEGSKSILCTATQALVSRRAARHNARDICVFSADLQVKIRASVCDKCGINVRGDVLHRTSLVPRKLHQGHHAAGSFRKQ